MAKLRQVSDGSSSPVYLDAALTTVSVIENGSVRTAEFLPRHIEAIDAVAQKNGVSFSLALCQLIELAIAQAS